MTTALEKYLPVNYPILKFFPKIIKGIERKVAEIHAANPTQTRLNGDDLQALEAMKKILQRSLMTNSAILREHIAQVNTITSQPRDNSAQESVKVLGQRVTKAVRFLLIFYPELPPTFLFWSTKVKLKVNESQTYIIF